MTTPPTPAPVSPLTTLKVIEFEGIGPGPMAGMMLAGLGAQVTVVKRPTRPSVGAALPDALPPELGLDRGKTAVTIDLKTPGGVAQALGLVAQHDALIEGLRPGAMERLGLGPTICHAVNPALVYGRMTGWGQTGPLAHAAGHDLNYVAITGVLGCMQRDPSQAPVLPPTVVGDAAGALGLAFGVCAAALHARSSGQGLVIDAAMVDISAMLGTLLHLTQAAGGIGKNPHAPLEQSVFHGSPFYDSFRCADARYITLCALEPAFYAQMLKALGLNDVNPKDQFDARQWPALKARVSAAVASHPMAHWVALLEGTDVCFAPVLTFAEAALHPHMVARGVYAQFHDAQRGHTVVAAAAPRFS